MDIYCAGDLIGCRCLVKNEEGETVKNIAGDEDKQVKTITNPEPTPSIFRCAAVSLYPTLLLST